MRRDQLLICLQNVNDVVKNIEFDDIMKELRAMGSDTKIDPSLVISKYAIFMESYNNFNEIEKQIIQDFDLARLSDVLFWSNMLGKQEVNHGVIFETNFNIKTLKKSTESFGKLLTRASDTFLEKIEGINPEGEIETITVSKMSVLIRENEMPDLKVGSFIALLNDMQALYNIIIRVYKLPGTELIIGSIDSGSDKSIDIIGISEAISKLKDLILEGWDRIRFNKEHKIEKSFKSVSEGIDVLDKIRRSVEDETMSAEEGEKLKRTVIRCMENLIGNGVYTPEADDRRSIRPSEVPYERKLMITYQDPGYPEKKLAQADHSDERRLPKATRKIRVGPSKTPSRR